MSTELIKAIEARDEQEAIRLLEEGPRDATVNVSTALHQAVVHKCPLVVEKILETPSIVYQPAFTVVLKEAHDKYKNQVDGWGRPMPPVIAAIKAEDEASALVLLKDDKLPYATDYCTSRTALHWAALKGFTSVAETLLTKENVYINERDENDTTALQLAARQNHPDIVALLLRQPNININNMVEGDTALSEAIYYKNIACVKLLLKHKDINIDNAYDDACSKYENPWEFLTQTAWGHGYSSDPASVLVIKTFYAKNTDISNVTERFNNYTMCERTLLNIRNLYYWQEEISQLLYRYIYLQEGSFENIDQWSEIYAINICIATSSFVLKFIDEIRARHVASKRTQTTLTTTNIQKTLKLRF